MTDIRSLVDRLVLGRKAWAVEVQLHADDQVYLCSALELHKKSVIIGDCREYVDVGSLAKRAKKSPVVLLLNGKGVLAKKFQGSKEPAIDTMFPGQDPSDFYVRVYEQGDDAWVGVCKRNKLDEIIDTLRSAGLRVVDVHLSSASIILGEQHFASRPNRLGMNLFEWREGSLEECHFDSSAALEEDVTFMERPVQFALTIISGLTFFGRTTEDVFTDQVGWFKEYIFYRLRLILSMSLLSILFLALVLSVVMGESYRRDVQSMQEEIAQYQQFIEFDKKASESLLVDQEMFGQIVPASETHNSTLLDEIGSQIPYGVSLVEIKAGVAINKSDRKNKAAEFAKDKIVILGNASRLKDVNRLIEQLAHESWVQSAEVQSVLFDPKEGVHSFEILLRV